MELDSECPLLAHTRTWRGVQIGACKALQADTASCVWASWLVGTRPHSAAPLCPFSFLVYPRQTLWKFELVRLEKTSDSPSP
mgnify:CR=1 FL=1